nr:transposase [Paenibacillus andongensis]
MSEYIHKSPNKSVNMYHFVWICLNDMKSSFWRLESRIKRTFLVQSMSRDTPMMVIQTIRSLTAREIFARHPEVKKKLRGEQFWSDIYIISSVSMFGSDATIRNYVKKQGTDHDYEKLHEKVDVG